MNSKEPSYHEVELPYESFSISWEIYNELRSRIVQLELELSHALDAMSRVEHSLLHTKDTFAKLQTRYEEFKKQYAQLGELE